MAEVLTDKEAGYLAEGLRTGRIAPENREKAMAMLDEFAGQRDARQEFYTKKWDRTPAAPEDLERIASIIPKGFASDEAREEYMQGPVGKAIRAGARGVDVNTGIDPSIRAKAGLLNFNPEVGKHVLEEMLRQQMPDVPPGVALLGNIEGVPVALQPREDGTYKYHAIDPVGFDKGDLGEFAAELPAIALETAGGVGGAIAGGAVGGVPGAVAGSAAGSAVLGGLAPDVRVWIAKQAGVPEDMIDDAVQTGDRLEAALIAGVGDLATAGFLGTLRYAHNAAGGKMLDMEDVNRVWDTATDSLDKAAAFKDKTGREVPLTLGMITGDSDLMAAERALKQRARGGNAMELTEESIRRNRAVQESLRDLTEQRVRGPMDGARSIEEVTEDVATGVRGEARAARQAEEQANEELDAFTRIADEQRSPETFVKVREDAFAAADEALNAERSSWDNYRAEVQWKQGEGSNIQMHSPAEGPIKKLLFQLDEDAQSALLESTRAAQQKFVKDAGLPDEGPTTGLAAEWLDPRELHFTLSDLKRRVRQAERSQDPDNFRVTDMKRMIGAIQETIENQPMRYRRAGRAVTPEKAARVREAWSHANDMSVKTHTLFDSANMQALLEINPRTKQLAMPQGMIYKRLFAEGDSRFLDEALEATGHNPQTKAALAEELVKKHRNATRTDRDGSRHRDFIDNHYDHLRTLGIDPANLRGARSLYEAVEAAAKAAKSTGERLARTFGRSLTQETTDPINIHKELLKVGPAKAQNVVDFLGRTNPQLLQEVRDHSLQQIRRDLAANGDTVINFDKLWELVDANGATVRALHGQDYLDALRTMKNLQSVVERGRLERAVPGQTYQPWFLDVTRSLWGPLSKKQRFLSAVQRTNRRLQARGARQVISTPEDLVALVKAKNRTVQDVLRDQTISDALRQFVGYGDGGEVERRAARGEAVQDARSRPTLGSTIVAGRESPREAVGAGKGPKAGEPDLALRTRVPAEAIDRIKRHEGFGEPGRPGMIYKDTKGKRTIGWGRNLTDNPITPAELEEMGTTMAEIEEYGITEEQGEVLLRNDLMRARKDAEKLPGYAKLNDVRQEVLMNMVFNMGAKKVLGFKNFLSDIVAGDYFTAADEMNDSAWRTQVKGRSRELQYMMRTGKRPSADRTVWNEA